jgi:predicted anti-sigma-YlaC factor YlaD
MKLLSKHVSHQLAAYIDGELLAQEAQRVERHLATCQRCQEEREQTQFGMAILDHLPASPVPDALWVAIEASLSERPAPRRHFDFVPRWQIALAALGVMVIAGATYWSLAQRSDAPWELVQTHGTPVANANPVHSTARVGNGAWIETDPSSTATLNIGNIGSVEVAPATRLLVVTARTTEHRLALVRGGIRAKISAPPKLFFVDTASGTAVDFGCEYSLHIDERGEGLLRVTKGWVSFQWRGLESLVPAGASCRTHPRAGPGVPYFDDAPPNFKDAVENFAIMNSRGASLDILLTEARVRDTLTLWHLLSRVGIRDRERIYDHIAALTPIPAGVSRENVLKLDPNTLTLWKDELAWTW